jgi:anti-sigma28 factor (negative regulator of flagellin synthesis)
MERFYYHSQIADFLLEDENTIFGKLSQAESFDTAREQKNAWVEEVRTLKDVLKGRDGDIIFEYSIPRLGKRVDVVLVISGIVFCLEFKAGADRYEYQAREQVWDYALDLKNFHEPSRDLTIVPILVATEAPDEEIEPEMSVNYDDGVYEPINANAVTLKEALEKVPARGESPAVDGLTWARGRYSPTPTIIQAASALYTKHNVADITRCDAGENLQKTTDFVLGVIELAKQNHEKSICFVTGVPGAGKTLVGLNVAMKQYEKGDPAVYLSGNGPLVEVLTEALARDKKRQEEEKTGARYNITEARRQVKSFIQIIHHYRDNTLAKLRQPIVGGKLEIDPERVAKAKQDGYAEVEHVAIFDEAQRLWDQPHLTSWLARKKGVSGFPMSESEFLIWSLDLREDWAVVVCLVGGGQEINSGEAGIAEPIRAVQERFPDWNVFISPQLTDKEYAEGNLDALLARNPRVQTDPSLHLATSMRSFRAEKLSIFVHQLLDRRLEAAKATYAEFADKYPIVLTRDIEKAKSWLRTQARGSERYGLMCSSQAFRLRPLAIDVRAKPEIVHWFLDDVMDIRSSLFLEDISTEFDIQGLELDWTCLVWDGDLRYDPSGWIQKDFNGGDWKNINSLERRAYQINAYRVLLTRARQGMVICVPEGDPADHTRKPEFYDATYEYLKSLNLSRV